MELFIYKQDNIVSSSPLIILATSALKKSIHTLAFGFNCLWSVYYIAFLVPLTDANCCRGNLRITYIHNNRVLVNCGISDWLNTYQTSIFTREAMHPPFYLNFSMIIIKVWTPSGVYVTIDSITTLLLYRS